MKYYKKYKELKKLIIMLMLIYILTVIFLTLNIKIRNEKITQQAKQIENREGEK